MQHLAGLRATRAAGWLRLLFGLGLLAAVVLVGVPDRTAHATTFVVTSTANVGPDTLRTAIANANANAGPDQITFAVSGTITLIGDLPTITGDLTITGPGQTSLTISGGNTFIAAVPPAGPTSNDNGFRPFTIAVGATVTISGLTIADGFSGSGAPSGNFGGAIRNGGTLTIENSTITRSHGDINGGGIQNDAGATLTITNSTVTGNTATNAGGISSGGVLTITDSTISSNFAEFFAGGIQSGGPTTTITNSTIASNQSFRRGGGIHQAGNGSSGPSPMLTITNSTIFGNVALGGAGGAGVMVDGSFNTVIIQNSTIVMNQTFNPGVGGGILTGGSNTLTLISTIVAVNNSGPSRPGPDIFSTTGSSGITATFSLIGDPQDSGIPAGGTNLFGSPALFSLADNGGPTQTLIPQATSQVVDNGANPANLLTDQRGPGFPRSVGQTDIGAVEFGSNFIVTNANDSGTGSLRQVILNANASPGANTITFDPSFFATQRTISLTSNLPPITEDVTITGPGQTLVTVSGGNSFMPAIPPGGPISNNDGFRPFEIAVGATVTISGLTIADGYSGFDSRGGAIRNRGTLTILDSTITRSFGFINGGGIQSDVGSTLTIANSTISGNVSDFNAGGLSSLGALMILDSTISGNFSTFAGGIQTSGGPTAITNSTIANNFASGRAGGIHHLGGMLTITNSTVFGNLSQSNSGGGGIMLENSSGTVIIQNTTIVLNQSFGVGGGGGILNGSSSLTLISTIVARNNSGIGRPGQDIASNPANITATFSYIRDLMDSGIAPPPTRSTTTSTASFTVWISPCATMAVVPPKPSRSWPAVPPSTRAPTPPISSPTSAASPASSTDRSTSARLSSWGRSPPPPSPP